MKYHLEFECEKGVENNFLSNYVNLRQSGFDSFNLLSTSIVLLHYLPVLLPQLSNLQRQQLYVLPVVHQQALRFIQLRSQHVLLLVLLQQLLLVSLLFALLLLYQLLQAPHLLATAYRTTYYSAFISFPLFFSLSCLSWFICSIIRSFSISCQYAPSM